MSLFRRRINLIPLTKINLGEFDINEPGGYCNVKTFRLVIKAGRDLHVRVSSDKPVDLAVSDEQGRCRSFKEGVIEGELDPIPFPEKEVVALVLGVFRGDKAELQVEAWLE